MSMHIGAKEGEIAPNILMPGDPLRSKYIAEHYLEDAFCFNEVRGMYGYTGTYKGQRVSVMAHGMGVPSMLIYAIELTRDYGCKKLVRIGTSGAFDPSLHVTDLVLSMGTSTNSAINGYTFPGHFTPLADFELLSKCYDLAKERGLRCFAGNTICNDHLYIDDKMGYSKIWHEHGVLATEMEGAALYTVAPRYKAKALTIMSITQNMWTNELMDNEKKERSLDDMIRLGLDTVID